MSDLHINVSQKIRARLSKSKERILDEQLKKINNLGRGFYGKSYNVGIAETYQIINQKSILGSGYSILEILEELELHLHGAPPDWIKEHPFFKRKEFEDNILPRSFTFDQFLRNVIKLNFYLRSKEYYNSFQAVYYGEHTGYVSIP